MEEEHLITRESTGVTHFVKTLDRLLGRIEKLVRNSKPVLNGERYLTDKEVSEKLKISRRTLQDYRTMGQISYYQLGGKILYRESDIQKMLEDNYRKSYL